MAFFWSYAGVLSLSLPSDGVQSGAGVYSRPSSSNDASPKDLSWAEGGWRRAEALSPAEFNPLAEATTGRGPQNIPPGQMGAEAGWSLISTSLSFKGEIAPRWREPVFTG
ncbi:hypothetical protein CHELA1G11_21025 [Hyphomicrobiales bacterium]|nr:hypothetical protein CHELA1G11_21025 [Hyphomicrobiales bacterium]